MAPPPAIRTLIVHTSAESSRLNADLVSHGQLQVVALSSAADALDKIQRYKPDVVALDLRPPVDQGCNIIRRIMTSHPLPVVVIGEAGTDSVANFAAIDAGAVAVAERPVETAGAHRDAQVAALAQTLQLMAEIRVVRRRPRPPALFTPPTGPSFETASASRNTIRLVAIGASTGGPAVLQTILSALPAEFALPIVVVQHIGSSFLDGMVHWLQQTTPLRLQLARPDEPLIAGHVYFAGSRQMAVNGGRIVLGSQEPVEGHCPSITYLFRSIARNYGPGAIGVLLTGMGKDGADGLWQMRQQGAVTIAQERDSCVVYGMPGAAEALDAVTHFLPPEKIAPALLAMAALKRASVPCSGTAEVHR